MRVQFLFALHLLKATSIL